jgi:hypothetical protein
METGRDAMKSWLNAHNDELEASLVFKTWLDTGGKPKSIQKALLHWLSIHGNHDDAVHVMASWLKARGSFSLIEDVASQWLSRHREDFTATFLIRFMAGRPGLSEANVRDILAWCRRFHQDQEVVSRFLSLDLHLLRKEVASEVVEITKLLVETALLQESLPRSASARLSALFALFSESARLRTQIGPLFFRWLRHPSSFNPSRSEVTYSKTHLAAQRPSILFYLRDLIDSGELSVNRDREYLLRFFNWIQTWSSTPLERVRPLLAEWARADGCPALE